MKTVNKVSPKTYRVNYGARGPQTVLASSHRIFFKHLSSSIRFT